MISQREFRELCDAMPDEPKPQAIDPGYWEYQLDAQAEVEHRRQLAKEFQDYLDDLKKEQHT